MVVTANHPGRHRTWPSLLPWYLALSPVSRIRVVQIWSKLGVLAQSRGSLATLTGIQPSCILHGQAGPPGARRFPTPGLSKWMPASEKEIGRPQLWLWTRLNSGGLGPLTQELALFDFCMGVSLQYDSGMPIEDCNLDEITKTTFKMTGGVALAVHVEDDIFTAVNFPSGKNGTWWDWCTKANARLEIAMLEMANKISGPWHHPMTGYYYLGLNGKGYLCDRAKM